jgi:hypothetical protein
MLVHLVFTQPASGDYSTALGAFSNSTGAGSFTSGYGSLASGNYAYAEGDTTASVPYSHAQGSHTIAVVDIRVCW